MQSGLGADIVHQEVNKAHALVAQDKAVHARVRVKRHRQGLATALRDPFNLLRRQANRGPGAGEDPSEQAQHGTQGTHAA